jgi:hypothetical protein
MHASRYRPRRATALCLVTALIAVLALGCDQPRSSARPSPSLVEIDVSRPPSNTAAAQSAEPTTQSTFVSIPVGWDNSFCGILADAVVAQELVIDIERALNEEPPAVRDARGLARDLRDITADAATLLTQVPAWDTGANAIQRLGIMVDLGTKAAEQYNIVFDQQSENALRRARGFRRDMARETQATNEALASIANIGIACEGTAMQLETF